MQVSWSNEQEVLSLPSNVDQLFLRVARRAAEVFRFPPNSELSIAIVDDLTISGLNEQYRGKAGPTDVLSFGLLTAEEMVAAPLGQPLLLGDVIISLERAKAQADAFGHSLERELAYLLAHGLAHIAGLDHDSANEGAMKDVTAGILNDLGITR